MGATDLASSCNALGSLFQGLITEMRDGVPVFEELASRTTKLHSSMRSTIVCLAAFLETFQKVADVATSSRGATKEIGKSLTRLCLRHRSIENKMKSFTGSLMEELAVPLQEKLDEWKRNAVQLDKEHAKDSKRARQEIKKVASDTLRLQKKAKKGKGEIMDKLDSAMQGVTDRYILLEECEKKFVRAALVEERRRYCDYICCLRPVMDCEISMVNEIQHLKEIVDHLSGLCSDPDSLPESSEQVISDLKGTNFSFKLKTPPDSPTSDRHSLASSSNSLLNNHETASDRSLSPGRINTLKSIHSTDGSVTLDSAYTSHEALNSKPHSNIVSRKNQARSYQSLEEEKSDSISVYSSISQSSHGSNDYESASLQSGSTHSISIPTISRAHTISGKPGGKPTGARASIASETYQPLGSVLASGQLASAQHRSSQSDSTDFSNGNAMMPPPPRPERMSSVPEDATLRTSQRNSTGSAGSSNRSSIVGRTRSKPKPVATPSIPFMDSEPIYMNTAQLAAQIAAEKKKQQDDEKLSTKSSGSDRSAGETAAGAMAKRLPVTTKDEIQEDYMSANLAAAVRELEASTAALHNLSDHDILDDRQAQNDALADAIKELEASTAMLTDCFEDSSGGKRQSIVSTTTSDYCTATSNSSASEETITVSNDTTDSSTTISDSIPLPSPGATEVSTPYGTATLRRPPGGPKPPPPVRHSSVKPTGTPTRQPSNPPSRQNSQRSSSKPPVVSPKPNLSNKSSRSSDSYPSPPTPIARRRDDEDPYAVPMNCQPIDPSTLPPPPPEFGHDGVFNIADLPPPVPVTPPQFTNTRSFPHVTTVAPGGQPPAQTPPWEQPSKSPATQKKVPPPVAAKKGKLKSDFVSQLNAKLGGNHTGPTVQNCTNSPSTSVQALAKQKSNTEPQRNHLLSQIQLGTQLKRTAQVNDRSAPKI